MQMPATAIPSFSVITGKEVHDVLAGRVPELIELVEQAYLAHHLGKTVNPESYFLRFPGRASDRIIALPAHLEDAGGRQVSGIKWIASYPGNIERGIPRASAVLVLNHPLSGYPFALLEASIISASRTAASAVSAANRLLPGRRVASVGLVGAGLIARYIITYLLEAGWQLGCLNIYDTSPDYAARFSARFGSSIPEIKVHPSVSSAISSSELVIFATTAAAPHVSDLGVFSHCPVVLNVSLRDLAPEIILASHNIVDDVAHCLKANTSPHLAEKMVGHRRFITTTLPEVIAGGKIPPRDRPIILSPFGMGILDLALGLFVYEKVIEAGGGQHINDFFHDTQRL